MVDHGDDLVAIATSIAQSSAQQLMSNSDVPELFESSLAALRQRDDAAVSRRAIRVLRTMVRAVHARECAAPNGDVSLVALVGDDALISLLHALSRSLARTSDNASADDDVVHESLHLLIALLDAQFAKTSSPAHWSRQYFFECDITEPLLNVLAVNAESRPLALHVLAALCSAKPVENANENAGEMLSRTAARVRALADVPKLDLLTATIDDGLKRCLRFYSTHTRPLHNGADENVFDRIASMLATPFAYLTGVPVDGFVPDDATHHDEVRDTAAALALLYELLSFNDTWRERLLTTGNACPRLIRRLLLLSSFVFGDAHDARSLLYASVCALLLERVASYDALFARLADDSEPFLLFALTQTQSTTPLAGAAAFLSTLTQLLHRSRSGPLALDTLTRAVRALLAALRAARDSRRAIEWARFASLWRAALTLLQRLAPLRVSVEARYLCVLTLQLLNDGITFGNSFLPSTGDYDALFYELLLQRGAIEDVVHAVELADSTPERAALRAQLVNLRIIVQHFGALLMNMDEANNDDANSVLRVIQRGLQSLKLRLLPAHHDAIEARGERQLMHKFVRQAITDIEEVG